jgi:hypothetical protein
MVGKVWLQSSPHHGGQEGERVRERDGEREREREKGLSAFPILFHAGHSL